MFRSCLARASARAAAGGRPLRPAVWAPRAARLASSHPPSGHDHHDDHHHEDNHDKPTMHPEDWLKVAREWPSDYYMVRHVHHESPIQFPAEHPTGEETTEKPATFFTPAFGKALVFGGVLFVAYQLNAYVTEGQAEHPLTRAIRANLRTSEEILADNKEASDRIARLAEDNRILLIEGSQPKPIRRVLFPDILYKASDFLITPGSQIDLSDVKVKTRWSEDDVYFGPPFPKDK